MTRSIVETNIHGRSGATSFKMVLPAGLLLMPLLLVSCQSGQPKRLIEEIDNPQLTERELRVELNEYVRHWMAAVGRAADEIVDRSDNTVVRRNAIRWKLDAVPACQTAAFRQDSVAALLDVWVLSAQMTQYLETGDGKDIFGQWQVFAIDAAKQLKVDIEGVARMLTDPELGRRLVTDWAEKHPIRGSLMARRTTAPLFAQYTTEPQRSTLGAIANIDQRIANLLERLDLYVEMLPPQMRWQAEYVIEKQMITREEKEDTLRNFATMSDSLTSMSGSLAQMSDSLVKMSSSLDTLSKLPEELSELVASERKAIAEMMNQQRTAMLQEVDALKTRTIGETARNLKDIFDYILWRVAIVGVILIALLFMFARIFQRLTRTKTNTASD